MRCPSWSKLLLLSALSVAPVMAKSLNPEPSWDNVRAVVLVDQRLYRHIRPWLNRYVELAEARRGFGIVIESIRGIDDWHFARVKQHLADLKQWNPSLEGALLVGNIKLPSFYKPRPDMVQVEVFTQYYEDLDGIFERRQEPGTLDPKCPAGDDYFCNVYSDELEVPPHDFDYMEDRAQNGPELWIAVMPVGLTDGTQNKYSRFGRQLVPYFKKLVGFYKGELVPEKRIYQVSNGLSDLSAQWDYYGPENIDFYSMNPEPKEAVPPGTPACEYCLRSGRTPADCYRRVPLEEYASFQAFQDTYQSRAWMGECWQIGSIFMEHMTNNLYEFVWVNAHSTGDFSVISSADAKGLLNGGIVMMAAGCDVAGFRQPDSPSSITSTISIEGNILMSYLYGSSGFTAALGDSFMRGHDANFQRIMTFINHGTYLGKAYFERMRLYHWPNATVRDLREVTKEMLLGDPFLDFTHGSL